MSEKLNRLQTHWMTIAERYQAETHPAKRELLVLESDAVLDAFNNEVADLVLRGLMKEVQNEQR